MSFETIRRALQKFESAPYHACHIDFDAERNEGADTRTVQRCEEAWQKVREAKGALLAEIEAALGCAAMTSPPEST
jgi:hypothetical protein